MALFARGLSTRDIAAVFSDADGRPLLSRAAGSQLGERLRAEDQACAGRDLAEHDIVDLVVDGIAGRLRPGQPREPVLAAWGTGRDGRKVLLHLMAGSREDTETVRALFQDMRSRGLGEPLLVIITAGAPGVIRAAGECSPRAARQRCLAHRMRNLAAEVPEPLRPEFKERARACSQAPSRAIARGLRDGVVAEYERGPPSAVRGFVDDFEACSAHLRPPITHRRALRATNLLERLFLEERRRLEVVPTAFGETAVLKPMYGAMIRAAERWRGLPPTAFERRRLEAVQAELDAEYRARIGRPAAAPQPGVSSTQTP